MEQVKAFMQETLRTLCDRACSAHPALLNELKARLVQEFIDHREAETKTAVKNIIETELSWIFTQDPSYEDTIHRVNEMVNVVRRSEVAYSSALRFTSSPSVREHAKAVGNVPADFISKMARCTAMSEDDDTYRLQVRAGGRTALCLPRNGTSTN